MKRYKLYTLSISLTTCMLFGFTWPVSADSRTHGLSYSSDHWPKRWSSAIRQQQGGKFPTRKIDKTPLAELPEGVSGQDLFYSPQQGQHYNQLDRRNNFNRDYQNQRQDRRQQRRHERNRYVKMRDAAFAYHTLYRAPPYGGNISPYGMNPYAVSMTTMDPVLGHPGMGIPMMPAIPGGYPMGGYPMVGGPFAYPGSAGMWSPPFGAW